MEKIGRAEEKGEGKHAMLSFEARLFSQANFKTIVAPHTIKLSGTFTPKVFTLFIQVFKYNQMESCSSGLYGANTPTTYAPIENLSFNEIKIQELTSSPVCRARLLSRLFLVLQECRKLKTIKLKKYAVRKEEAFTLAKLLTMPQRNAAPRSLKTVTVDSLAFLSPGLNAYLASGVKSEIITKTSQWEMVGVRFNKDTLDYLNSIIPFLS